MSTTKRSTRVKAPTNIRPKSIEHSIIYSNDESSLPNPQGRSEIDVNRKTVNKEKFLKCKKDLLVSTINVRTLRNQHKQKELAYLFKRTGIAVLGIQDHKIVHEEKVRSEEIHGCVLITTSAWRNRRNAAVGGGGLMINNSTSNVLTDVGSFNERMIIVHFNGNPKVTLIVQYSPTEGSDDAKEHYTNLVEAISSIPKHNVLIVVGDFNAHLGKNEAKYTYHNNTNSNGQFLLDLACECNLLITNTTFQKRSGKLWTYFSDMTTTKTQIDYILINKKWKNSLKNVEAYNTFSSIDSDHRILSARLRLSLRTSKAPTRDKQYDWNSLRSNTDLQEQYTITVRNRYDQLYAPDATDTENYQHFIDANNKAAKELIPIKKNKKRKEYAIDDRIVRERNEVNMAFAAYEKETTEENHVLLQMAKDKLSNAYNIVEAEVLDEQIRQVENADERSRHGESWKLINEISGRKKSQKGIIKGENKEKRLKSWYEHFSQLLGNEPVITEDCDDPIPPILEQLEIKRGPFTFEEYQTVKKKITENKASGSDHIPPEVLKRCDLDDIILKFANNLLYTEQNHISCLTFTS